MSLFGFGLGSVVAEINVIDCSSIESIEVPLNDNIVIELSVEEIPIAIELIDYEC